MESSNARNVTTGVLIVLVIAALALAFLRPTSEITLEVGPPVDFEEATALEPVITSVGKEGGFRFLGITFSSPTYRVQVGFTASPECGEAIGGAATWPTGIVACEPDGAIAGELSASGRTAGGDTIVGVTFEVEEDCYEVLATGQVWGSLRQCE